MGLLLREAAAGGSEGEASPEAVGSVERVLTCRDEAVVEGDLERAEVELVLALG